MLLDLNFPSLLLLPPLLKWRGQHCSQASTADLRFLRGFPHPRDCCALVQLHCGSWGVGETRDAASTLQCWGGSQAPPIGTTAADV